MKNILEAIINTFNNEFIKALYITIFIFILMSTFVVLVINFPIILGILLVLAIFLGIYMIVLDVLS